MTKRRRLTGALRHLPFDQQTRHRLRSLLLRLARSVGLSVALPGKPPNAVPPVGRDANGLDFLYFGIVDWHFRFQRPQQLALQLARRGHRVLYVSSDFVDDPGSGFRVERIDPGLCLYQVYLHLRRAPGIYWNPATQAMADQLSRGVNMALQWSGCNDPIFVLGHPFWSALWGSGAYGALVYDRMDFHEGFGSFTDASRKAEEALMRNADLTVCSSRWLARDAGRNTQKLALIPNATDFEHFAARPHRCYEDPQGRRIIGYYGAIAPWLDLDIVEAIAERFPDCSVLLIGRDQMAAASRLSRHPNVTLLGEVPYARLPSYLHAFDVCILPRVNNALTRAMNPVKLYEYLSTGLPVVATKLPEVEEMDQIQGLIYACDTKAEFIDAVAMALAEPADNARIKRRRRYAAGQTWASRAEDWERQMRPLLRQRGRALPG